MLSDIPLNVILMQLFFGLALGSIFVIMASGLSIIYGLLDVVNFAHGVFAMLGAYVVFCAVSLSGNFAVGIVSAIVIVALIGALVEVVPPEAAVRKGPAPAAPAHLRPRRGHSRCGQDRLRADRQGRRLPRGLQRGDEGRAA